MARKAAPSNAVLKSEIGRMSKRIERAEKKIEDQKVLLRQLTAILEED